MSMSWIPLVAAVVGALIALSGTLFADVRRDRQQRNRDYEQFRRETYVEFVLALNAAHAALRKVSDSPMSVEERRNAVNAAMSDAGLYGAREQLLMTATTSVVKAGEAVFHRVVGIRKAVRDGATTSSVEYHEAYHPFAEALWKFRMVVRTDFRQLVLAPMDVDRTTWSELESCAVCGRSMTQR
ncbi:hypothetical protein AB0C01_07470 [Micromonospora sp. NPDC048905]|uniref:hypothetical protein n=1 Tax=Micromonospora sp. NPDC048905 TaxID=3155494 RepID=UPI0033E37FCF